jgi:phage/plasmid-associated DNA primase
MSDPYNALTGEDPQSISILQRAKEQKSLQEIPQPMGGGGGDDDMGVVSRAVLALRTSSTVRYWIDPKQGVMWKCDLSTGLWEVLNHKLIAKWMTIDLLPNRRSTLSFNQVEDIQLALMRMTEADPEMKTFCPGAGPVGHMAFRNGLLNLTTWEFRSIRPSDGLTSTALYDYREADGDPDILLSTLRYITGGSQEAIDALMALIYITTAGVDALPKRRLKFLIPIFVTKGGDGGRSTLFEFIAALVGDKSMPSMKWDELGDKVALEKLIGAKAARVAEVQNVAHGRSTSAANLKLITGGDGIQARILGVGYHYVPQTMSAWVATNRDDVFCNLRDVSNRVLAFVSEPIPQEVREKFDREGLGRKILEPEECLKAIGYFRRRFGDLETAARVVETYANSLHQKEVRADVLTGGDSVVRFIDDCLRVCSEQLLARFFRFKKHKGQRVAERDITTLNVALLYQHYRNYCQHQAMIAVKQKVFEEEFVAATGRKPKAVKMQVGRVDKKALPGVFLKEESENFTQSLTKGREFIGT